jgi:hypothetical protein
MDTEVRVFPLSWIELLRRTKGKYDDEAFRGLAYTAFAKEGDAYAHAQHLSHQSPCVTFNLSSGCGMEWENGRAKLMRVVF